MAAARLRTLDVSGVYDGLAAQGYGYGPAFQGLRAAWRHGTDVYAEVALPEDAAADAAAFGLHPRCWTRRCTPPTSTPNPPARCWSRSPGPGDPARDGRRRCACGSATRASTPSR
ncbi:polyketide synthase dehydratase domain-containing protein [Streptomyces sp. M19]